MFIGHKVLLIAHAIGAGVLLGSSTHLALQSLSQLRGRGNPRLLRIYPTVALLAWLCVFAMGLVLYPRYRVVVRRDYLDVSLRWVSRLFDVKEYFALLVGPLLASARWMAPRSKLSPAPFAAACCAASALLWATVLLGLFVTSVRSV